MDCCQCDCHNSGGKKNPLPIQTEDRGFVIIYYSKLNEGSGWWRLKVGLTEKGDYIDLRLSNADLRNITVAFADAERQI